MAIPLLYLVCVVVGLLPVNNDFVETEDGVTICVFSGQFHSDLILPVKNDVVDWHAHFPPSDFSKSKVEKYDYVAIGWGDRGFYMMGEIENISVPLVANAVLIPSRTVMHVQYQRRPLETDDQRNVRISTEQYRQLTKFILASLRSNADGVPKKIDFAYHTTDAFYVGAGSYHAFNTCNCWAANAIKTAGVRVPWFSPLPKTILKYLPNKRDNESDLSSGSD